MKMLFLTSIMGIGIALGTSCELHKVHQPLHSTSIKESKEKGVYVKSYKPVVIILNDSIQFEIKEAWCERTFYYDDIVENGRLVENRDVNTYGLIFITTESIEREYKGYSHNWWIENCSFGQEEQENICSCQKIEPFKETEILGDTITLSVVHSRQSVNREGYSIIEKLETFRLIRDSIN